MMTLSDLVDLENEMANSMVAETGRAVTKELLERKRKEARDMIAVIDLELQIINEIGGAE